MKNYRLFLINALVFLICSSIANAQGIFVFDISSPVVSNGKITINNTNVATPITFKVIATTQRDITTFGPFAADMVITLVYEKNGIIEEISSPMSIANSAFSSNLLSTTLLTFSGTLPANKIGGVIKLKYSCFDYVTSPTTKVTKYTSVGYETILPPVVSPAAPIDWSNPANAKFIVVGFPGRHTFNAGTTVLRNGVYHLEFQSDGNLVLYNGTTPIWASGKKRGNNSTQVRFYDSGIGCYEGNTNYYWVNWAPRPINIAPNAVWVLQDDGNFVCYRDHDTDSNGVIIPYYAYAIGATMTQGGQKSNRSGRIN
ncbi:MAG: hypothetical protein WC623_11945 [Pedobacter sp.]|uniref:hypothetical protein n=1 Tax=Pedobacter sp. TaxID=1411316 RepID=UPI0035615A14